MSNESKRPGTCLVFLVIISIFSLNKYLNKHPDFYYTLRIFYSGKLLMFNTLFEEGYAPSSR